MTGEQFKMAIAKVGLSQERAGLFFGVAGRQGRRWASGTNAVPEAVVILLNLLLAGKLSLSDVVLHKTRAADRP